VFFEDSQPAAGVVEVQQQSAEQEVAEAGLTSESASAPAPASAPGDLRCSAVTKAGKPCVNRPGPGGRCVAHTEDEGVKAMVHAARVAGGKAPRIRVGLNLEAPDAVDTETVEGVQRLMAAVIRAVAVNKISGTQAQSIVSAAKVALQAQELTSQARIRELQDKLDALTVDQRGARR
jgi:hypothetical protein